MASAFKDVVLDWREPEAEGGMWTRQTSSGASRTQTHDDVLVVKRTAYARRRPVTFLDDPNSWVRLRLRKRPMLAANRDDPHHDAIEAQVDELRQSAAEDGEAFCEASATQALTFCHELAADREPAIFLMANGNLRAVWRNAERDQIGIQFMGDDLLQYVILRDRDGRTLKALGEDVSAERVRHTVEVQDLTELWFLGKR